MARTRKSNLTAGLILVVIGGILLVTRFALLATAPAWLLGLGVGLALIAIVTRAYGALVGGMILLGLGAGMALGDREVGGVSPGAWIQLGLGAGFVGIWVLALILGLKRHWWPLVPGVILLALGGARFLRHIVVIPPQAMIAVRTWWPAALVVAGIWVLVRGLRK
jgi:hypothetical protein